MDRPLPYDAVSTPKATTEKSFRDLRLPNSRPQRAGAHLGAAPRRAWWENRGEVVTGAGWPAPERLEGAASHRLPAVPRLSKKIDIGRGKGRTIAGRQVRLYGLQEQLGDAGMAEIVRVEPVGVTN